MGMVIVGLLPDAQQARAVIRALDDAGFSGDDIDMGDGLLSQLVARGVPDEDAHALVEGVRRGGALVCVRTDDAEEAAEAAELMCAHGAPGRIYQDARRRPYTGPERRVRDEPYPGIDRRAV